MKKSIGQEAFGKLQTKIVILKSILGLDLSVLVDTLKLPIDFSCNDMFIPVSWHRCGEQGEKRKTMDFLTIFILYFSEVKV